MKKRIVACLLMLCMLLSCFSTAFMEEEAHTHDFKTASETSPTCTEAGSRTLACDCGETRTESVSAKGHDWSDWVVTAEPSCSETGSKERHCSRCEAVETETIAPAGHSYTSEITAPATCEEAGEILFTCSVCGDTRTEVEPALGHDWNDGELTTAPSCEGAGEMLYTCSDCGAKRTETVPANGHIWGEGTQTKAPDCEAEGELSYTCFVCGATRTEAIPANGHSYGEAVQTIAPACETEGELCYTCSVCGAKRTEAIPATGHSYGEGTVTLEPTCTAEGEMSYTCSVCGAVRTEAVAALGHELDEGAVTLEPTCTEAGVLTCTCERCGETVETEIPALGHDIKDNVCTRCGYTRAAQIGDTVYESAAEALAAAKPGELVTVYVAEGELVLPAGVSLKLECRGVTVLPAEGCALIVEGDVYTAVKAVAKIGETGYAYLADALADAVDGDTVVLLDDITLDKGVTVKSGITLDFNKKTIYAEDLGEKAAILTIDAKKDDVTLMDGAIEGEGVIKYLVQNDLCQTLTLVDMTLDITEAEDIRYALSNNAGEVILTGKTELLAKLPEDCEEGKLQYASDANNKGTVIRLAEEFKGSIQGAVNLYKVYTDVADVDKFVIDETLSNDYAITLVEGEKYVFIDKPVATLLSALMAEPMMEDAGPIVVGDGRFYYLHDGKEYRFETLAEAVDSIKVAPNIMHDVSVDDPEETGTLTFSYDGTGDNPKFKLIIAPNRGTTSGVTTIVAGTIAQSMEIKVGQVEQVNINDGTFTNCTFLDLSGKMVINGGTFTNCIFSGAEQKLQITGGTFTDCTFSGPYIEITGGTFNSDPSTYVPPTHVAIKDETKGVWTVVSLGDYEASVTTSGRVTTYYADISDALTEAGSGDTVKLLKDIGKTVNIISKDNITLDLNGYNITANDIDAVYIEGSKVTIVVTVGNSHIKKMDGVRNDAVYVSGKDDAHASLNIQGGHYDGEILINNDNYASVVITGGYFSDRPGINYIPADYEIVGPTGDYYSVQQKKDFVAEVGGIKYTSLTEAVTEAALGATVTILKDFSTDGRGVEINKDLVIDFNGKIITHTPKLAYITRERDIDVQHFDDFINVKSGITLTLKNGTIVIPATTERTGGINAGAFYANSSANGTFTFDGMMLFDHNTGAWSESNKHYLICVKNGTTNLQNGTKLSGEAPIDPDCWKEQQTSKVIPAVGTKFSHDPRIALRTGGHEGVLDLTDKVLSEGSDTAYPWEVFSATDMVAYRVVDGQDVYYSTLRAAVSAAQSGDTIYQCNNIVTDGREIEINKDLTIQFDSTYTVEHQPAGDGQVKSDGRYHYDDLFNVKDANLTINGGNITIKKAEPGQSQSNFKGSNAGLVLVSNIGVVTLNGVTAGDTDDAAYSANYKHYLLSVTHASNAKIVLAGGTKLYGTAPIDYDTVEASDSSSYPYTVVAEEGVWFETMPVNPMTTDVDFIKTRIDLQNGLLEFAASEDGYVIAKTKRKASVTTNKGGKSTTYYYGEIEDALHDCKDPDATYVLTILGAGQDDKGTTYAPDDTYTIPLTANLSVVIAEQYLDERTIYSIIDGKSEDLVYPWNEEGENQNGEANGNMSASNEKFILIERAAGADLAVKGIMRSAEVDASGRYTFMLLDCPHQYTTEYLTKNQQNGFCPNCGQRVCRRADFKATVDGNDDVTITFEKLDPAFESGWVYTNSSYTVTLPKVPSNWTYDSWYMDSIDPLTQQIIRHERMTADQTVTSFVLAEGTDDVRMIANFKYDNREFKVTVTSTEDYYIYEYGQDKGQKHSSGTSTNFTKGKTICIEYAGTDWKRFGAWTNQNDLILSENQIFTMVVVSNMDVHLHQKTVSGDSLVWIQFNTTDGQILQSGQYDVNTVAGMPIPMPHTRLGQKFYGWFINDGIHDAEHEGSVYYTNLSTNNLYDALKAAIAAKTQVGESIILTPDIRRYDAGTYTVVWKLIKDDEEGFVSQSTLTAQIGVSLALNAEPSLGDYVFDHYEIDANPATAGVKGRQEAGYNLVYVVKPRQGTSDKTLNVYTIYKRDRGEEKVIVRASEKYGTYLSNVNKYRLSFQCEFCMPESGYTMLERGILYTASEDWSKPEMLIVEMSDSQTDNKVVGKATYSISSSLRCGTMTLNVNTSSSTARVWGRGFLTYKQNSTGKIFTSYSDVMEAAWNTVGTNDDVTTGGTV